MPSSAGSRGRLPARIGRWLAALALPLAGPLAGWPATPTQAPQVAITPARIETTAATTITIAVQYPSGLASITGVQATYNGLDVLDLLFPFLVQVGDTAATFVIPQVAFPYPTQATFVFSLQTGAGSDSATLQIDVRECGIFPPDNPWNTDIAGYPLNPNSDAYVASINSSGGNGFLHADFGSNPDYGIPYVVVPAGQALVPITFTEYGDESDPGPYPVPLSAPVEAGSDRHVLVVQPSLCRLYELYHAARGGAGWEAGSGAIFALDSNQLRPEGWTSADAAGLPIFAGLARFDEVQSGHIDHALRFTATRTQRGYIHPATHYASSSNDPSLPPMGLRLRLKDGYDLSRFHGAARVILEALKKYGLLLADNGTGWFITGATDSRWDDQDLDQLKTVPGSAFEAVQTGAIHHP
jgi:hypothetical protein